MKKFLYISTVVLLLALVACEKVSNKNMTVVSDCTGTYLKYNGKDYHVCNLEAVASFPDGSSVTATFKKNKKCTGSAQDAFVCMMVHENEGWITVEKIE